jgi:hypothetical protein
MVCKGYKYKVGQIVYLKGTKSTGLGMDDVLDFQTRFAERAPPWPDVTGKIVNLYDKHSNPSYNVMIQSRWMHFFAYKGITLAEKDIFIEGENPNIEYLDEGLFEL